MNKYLVDFQNIGPENKLLNPTETAWNYMQKLDKNYKPCNYVELTKDIVEKIQKK